MLSQNTQKTQIYKPFGADFSLNNISDVYEQFNSGKEIYFLNSNNQSVKVKSIEKVPYKDKIDDMVVSSKHKVYAKIIGQDEQFRLMSVTEVYELVNTREKSSIVKILIIQLYLEHLENPLRIFSVLNWRLVLRSLTVLTKLIPETEGFVIERKELYSLNSNIIVKKEVENAA